MDLVSCGFLVFLVQPQIAVHNNSCTQLPHYIFSSFQEFLPLPLWSVCWSVLSLGFLAPDGPCHGLSMAACSSPTCGAGLLSAAQPTHPLSRWTWPMSLEVIGAECKQQHNYTSPVSLEKHNITLYLRWYQQLCTSWGLCEEGAVGSRGPPASVQRTGCSSTSYLEMKNSPIR